MRSAGCVVGAVLEALRQAIQPGITTAELDTLAETVIRDMGAKPSFKGYQGFPASICASVNQEIVHGFPGTYILQDGDIISVDVGAIKNGYQGDAATTVAVGCVSERAKQLMAGTERALEAGIAAARVGAHLTDISHAVEVAARAANLEIVREYGGHGIGREMHEPPLIWNWGSPGRGPVLDVGMTLCVEPMLTLGGFETQTLEDGWTVVTADGSLSAHYEHTILITRNGAEKLTLPPTV